MNPFHLRQGRGAAAAAEGGLAWRATPTGETTWRGGRGRYGARTASEEFRPGAGSGRRELRPGAGSGKARAPAGASTGRRGLRPGATAALDGGGRAWRAGVEGDGAVRGRGGGQPWRGRAHGSGLTGGSHTNRCLFCRPGWRPGVETHFGAGFTLSFAL